MPTMTDSAPLILQSAINQFHTEGYCVVGNLWTEAELVEIEAFFESYKTNGQSVFDAGFRFEEIDPQQRQLRAMHPHRYSERAKQWALNPRVLQVLEVLFQRAPLLAQTMYYFKPPGAKGQGMHQDNFYLLAEPHACIAAWTAIDAAEVENGCLYVVPGSNLKSIHCPAESAETWLSYGDSHIKPFPRDAKPIPVTVPRGHTMFFGGRLIHGSGPNRTQTTSRRTFIGHYIDDASEKIAQFYHPVLNRHGDVVATIQHPEGGGPCGDGWLGATH